MWLWVIFIVVARAYAPHLPLVSHFICMYWRIYMYCMYLYVCMYVSPWLVGLFFVASVQRRIDSNGACQIITLSNQGAGTSSMMLNCTQLANGTTYFYFSLYKNTIECNSNSTAPVLVEGQNGICYPNRAGSLQVNCNQAHAFAYTSHSIITWLTIVTLLFMILL